VSAHGRDSQHNLAGHHAEIEQTRDRGRNLVREVIGATDSLNLHCPKRVRVQPPVPLTCLFGMCDRFCQHISPAV
jgi:hypothetical protein